MWQFLWHALKRLQKERKARWAAGLPPPIRRMHLHELVETDVRNIDAEIDFVRPGADVDDIERRGGLLRHGASARAHATLHWAEGMRQGRVGEYLAIGARAPRTPAEIVGLTIIAASDRRTYQYSA